MIKLNIKGTEVEPSFTYGLYKNIAGKEREERSSKFNTFLNGIFNDDMNQVIYFFYCVAGGKIPEDEIVAQISEQKGFENIHAVSSDILQGFMSDGFFATAVQQLLNSVADSIKSMQEAYKMPTLTDEDREVGKLQIEERKKALKEMEKRIKK
ncbi:hypothetical protein D1B17_07040 [Companilactobacillus zhachilii]|uniref:Uncharacterized protein n=1 Tax=Companilactobacillus zhachilii TaxID=2304606 RepID=A0A386PR78_9LACO|nr:hypothetical protein [Companilactobacillus zhachilii]AYE38404.1 hypothetical protein D1B17_07040 [Companilactobacillus zhachilii]